MVAHLRPRPSLNNDELHERRFGRSRRVLERIGQLAVILGPTTVLAGFLYYVGHVSTQDFYSHFSISVSVLDIAPTSLLPGSVDELFDPGSDSCRRGWGQGPGRSSRKALPIRSQAVVYSRTGLRLTGPGIGVTELPGTLEDFRYRYNGLRPLLHTNDTWILLRVGWTSQNGSTVIMLADAPEWVRVDLAR